MANDILQSLAEREKLPLVDLNRILLATGRVNDAADSLLRNPVNSGEPDGVHLTPEGYRFVAAAVYCRLLDMGWKFRKVVCLGDSLTYGVHVAGGGTIEGECYPARLRELLS